MIVTTDRFINSFGKSSVILAASKAKWPINTCKQYCRTFIYLHDRTSTSSYMGKYSSPVAKVNTTGCYTM